MINGAGMRRVMIKKAVLHVLVGTFLFIDGAAAQPVRGTTSRALGTNSDTLRATVVATLAEDSPRTPHIFGRVTGVAVDDGGRVYVTDGGEFHVAVFSSTGALVTTIGRKGKGPGEFEYPTGPVVGSDGALYVRNMSSVSRFVADAKTGALSRFDRAFNGPAMAPWMSMLPTAIDRAGRLHFPLEWGQADGLTYHAFVRFSLAGTKLDSLPVPMHPTARSAWASVMVSANSGRLVPGLATVPFHPVPVFTVSAAGTVISSPSDAYLLNETDVRKQVVRQMRRDVAPTNIPPRERDDSAKALGRRLDSLRVPISSVRGMSEEVKARKLPATYPVFRSLFTAADGSIWARRWTSSADGRRSVYDVLDEQGRLRQTVTVPADCQTLPVPVVRGTVFSCVQLEPETDLQAVVIVRLPAPR